MEKLKIVEYNPTEACSETLEERICDEIKKIIEKDYKGEEDLQIILNPTSESTMPRIQALAKAKLYPTCVFKESIIEKLRKSTRNKKVYSFSKMTRAEILEQNICKKTSYGSLINELIKLNNLLFSYYFAENLFFEWFFSFMIFI